MARLGLTELNSVLKNLKLHVEGPTSAKRTHLRAAIDVCGLTEEAINNMDMSELTQKLSALSRRTRTQELESVRETLWIRVQQMRDQIKAVDVEARAVWAEELDEDQLSNWLKSLNLPADGDEAVLRPRLVKAIELSCLSDDAAHDHQKVRVHHCFRLKRRDNTTPPIIVEFTTKAGKATFRTRHEEILTVAAVAAGIHPSTQ